LDPIYVGTGGYAPYLAASAARNDVTVDKLVVVWGTWTEASDFVSCGTPPGTPPPQSNTTCYPNAVEVTASETTDYFFQPGSGDATRAAVATYGDPLASYQVGSRLVSIDASQAILLNAVFSGSLGGVVDLTAVGYSGLLDTGINLGSLATELNFGTVDELAVGSVGAHDFYLATAQVMENQGDTAAATALNAIALQSTNTTMINMSDLMVIEQGGSAAAANAEVDMWSLLTGSIFAINGTNLLSIPGATLGVAGTSTTVNLTVIEKPRMAFGVREGYALTTSQVSASLTTTIANLPTAISGLTGATVSGTIPVSLTAAQSTAPLLDIDCDWPGIDVGHNPQPLSISAGANLTLSANVVLLGNVPIASAVLSSRDVTNVAVTGTSPGASFAYTSEFLPPIGAGTMKPAPTNTVTLAGALAFTSGHITLLNAVAVPAGTIANALNVSVLNPVLTAISDAVIEAQLDTLLGLDFGGADIGAIDMDCEGAGDLKLVA
jgi:hypothetical protein